MTLTNNVIISIFLKHEILIVLYAGVHSHYIILQTVLNNIHNKIYNR